MRYNIGPLGITGRTHVQVVSFSYMTQEEAVALGKLVEKYQVYAEYRDKESGVVQYNLHEMFEAFRAEFFAKETS